MSNMIVKVSDNFRDRYEFARTHIKRDTVISQLALFCIMAVAILLRFMPAFEFDWTLFALDPYSQLIAARAIDTKGILSFLTYVDPNMWFPDVGQRNFGLTQNFMTPVTAVIVKRVFQLFGVNFSIEQAAFLAPGFCGVLTVLIAYFLGKELANKRVGLISSFILAFSTGHIQRSMAGDFNNEAVGIMFMLLTFYLFLRALRTGSFITSFLAGLSLGGLILSWGGSTYGVQLISLYVIVLLLLKKYSLRLLTAFSGTILPALLLAVLYPREGPGYLLQMDALLPLGVLSVIIVFSIYESYKNQITRLPYLTSKNLEIGGYTVVLGTIGFLILNFFIPILPTFRAKFITVVIPYFRQNSPLLNSVAEYLIQTWATMFQSLFLLEFLVPLAIIYLFKKPTENNIFLLLYLLTAFYFGSSMIRLILILGPAAAFGAAKAIEEILVPFAMVRQEKFFLSKRKRTVSVSIGQEHVGIAFIIIFAILTINILQSITVAGQIIQPASIATEYKTNKGTIATFGTAGDGHDWFETLDWLSRNTPSTSVIGSWWDYGYWLTLANRTIVVDGATLNSTQIGNIGAMFVSTPDIALKIASHYGIDYIVVLVGAGSANLDNDLGKVQWMVKIAETSGTLDKAYDHRIVSSNFLTYGSDGKTVSSYTKDFFTSLIWAFLTAGVSSQITGQYQNSGLVASNSPMGYASQYSLYSQIFKEVHMSANSLVRVMHIDWNAAERLVGVSK